MYKEIKYDYMSQNVMQLLIPVTKKYEIRMTVRDKWISGVSGIYPPCIEVYYCGKCVTDLLIERTPDKVIEPTAHNLQMMISIIEEAILNHDAAKVAPNEEEEDVKE